MIDLLGFTFEFSDPPQSESLQRILFRFTKTSTDSNTFIFLLASTQIGCGVQKKEHCYNKYFEQLV